MQKLLANPLKHNGQYNTRYIIKERHILPTQYNYMLFYSQKKQLLFFPSINWLDFIMQSCL
jgi:hypothetical protein